MPPPTSWFWSHDIRPEQISGLLSPGDRLVRLSSYGSRFAAVVHHGPGPRRSFVLDARPPAAGAVSVTVDDEGRFAVVVEDGARTELHTGLDETAVRAAVGVLDIAPYTVAGQRVYAVVLGPGSGRVVTGRPPRTGVTRLRRDVAVVEAGERTWWYADLDADAVARKLTRHRAYPTDLDATRDERGVRFAVIMRR